MERTIKVTGTGHISLEPDQINISLTFRKVEKTYDKALKAASKDVVVVKDALANAGIERNTIKTTSFDVDTKYEYYTDANKENKKRFVGYEYVHHVIFSFDLDNKTLGKVLYELAHINVYNDFNIYYDYKDKEGAKNELLKNAIKDAKKKAEIIADASEVKLGEIIEINYSMVEVEFRSGYRDRSYELLMDKCSYDIDINPRNIEESDSVTVIYSIQ